MTRWTRLTIRILTVKGLEMRTASKRWKTGWLHIRTAIRNKWNIYDVIAILYRFGCSWTKTEFSIIDEQIIPGQLQSLDGANGREQRKSYLKSNNNSLSSFFIHMVMKRKAISRYSNEICMVLDFLRCLDYLWEEISC